MKTKIIISFFILFGVFSFSQTLKSTISTTSIRYGEPIILTLEVSGNKSDTIIFPQLKDTLSYHLEILNNKQEVVLKNNKSVYLDSISFSAYELGSFTVPSLKVLINSQEHFTPSYNIKVDSIAIDTLKRPLYDIRPIIVDPKSFMDYLKQYWVYAVIILVISIIVIIVIVLYYLERKKKGKNKRVLHPDIIAVNKINKLEKANYPEKGMSKKFYSELINILKEYMENRWDFPAFKLLSDDLIIYLEENQYISEETQKDLEIIFRSADLAKFAKSQPTFSESKVHTELAKKFIEETKTETLILEHEYDR